MVRIYKQSESLPPGLQENWGFLSAAYDVLNARAPELGWTSAYVSPEGQVGSHEVETVDEARAAYEDDSRGDIASVVMSFQDTTEGIQREFVCRVRAQGGRISAASPDEPEVRGVVETVAHRAEEAIQRQRTEQQEAEAPERVVLVEDETARKGWRAFFHNPSVVGIVGGLIVVAIAAWIGSIRLGDHRE